MSLDFSLAYVYQAVKIPVRFFFKICVVYVHVYLVLLVLSPASPKSSSCPFPNCGAVKEMDRSGLARSAYEKQKQIY